MVVTLVFIALRVVFKVFRSVISLSCLTSVAAPTALPPPEGGASKSLIASLNRSGVAAEGVVTSIKGIKMHC